MGESANHPFMSYTTSTTMSAHIHTTHVNPHIKTGGYTKLSNFNRGGVLKNPYEGLCGGFNKFRVGVWVKLAWRGVCGGGVNKFRAGACGGV